MKKSLKGQLQIFIVLVLIFLTVVLIVFLQSNKLSKDNKTESSHVITLTEEGFSPQNSTIKKGEAITFKTTRNKMFWPASNLHPTHEIYPEFDPKEPIDPDKTWSFRFGKVGNWRFHDHLSPYYEGSIKVVE